MSDHVAVVRIIRFYALSVCGGILKDPSALRRKVNVCLDKFGRALIYKNKLL
jgi:hypothetical protein